jgi:peptidoglycan/xylan/chitin deacetylase (PgdA/CDA1 family)
MYHSVTDNESSDPYSVSARFFFEQISLLIDQGYQFVSLSALAQLKKDNLFAREQKQVVLTFDDGYQDFLINALPILLRYRLPATVFLVTGMLGQATTWSRYNKEIPLMTEQEVYQVKKHGIGLGSHTVSHVDLTSIADDELWWQLVKSRTTLSDFGETFYSFSYPWGKYTEREVTALKSAGYECAVTVGEPVYFFRPDLFQLGRLVMQRNLDLESFQCMIKSKTRLHRFSVRFRALKKLVQKAVYLTK